MPEPFGGPQLAALSQLMIDRWKSKPSASADGHTASPQTTPPENKAIATVPGNPKSPQ